ncbi:MAG: glycosyltransferase [Phycisphaerales bacterium]|nr:glycosyltransferase [Phycisphaerales bacterium]
MRVALLVTDLERGGTPLRLAATARHLAARGVDVRVGCLRPPGPVSEKLNRTGIETFACGARSVSDVGAVWRLRNILRGFRPHLIHSTLFHANIAARIVGWTLRIPVVTSTATIEVERKWHLAIERLTQRCSAAHVVNSIALAEHLIRDLHIARRRIHVVPPFLETEDIPERAAARAKFGLGDHEFAVAWLGRFDVVKRLDLVIRAAEILSGSPYRFLLAGDGPARQALEKLIRTSSVARRVTLLGWLEQPAELLTAADAFIFPSLTEGQPNALMQAMRAGLPIVASDIPAHRALRGDPQRLELVSSQEPAHYARALSEIRTNIAAARDMGERARAFALREFDSSASISALLSAYSHVLENS